MQARDIYTIKSFRVGTAIRFTAEAVAEYEKR